MKFLIYVLVPLVMFLTLMNAFASNHLIYMLVASIGSMAIMFMVGMCASRDFFE